MTEPRLFTEAEAEKLCRNAFSNEIMAELRERGLIAEEPVDQLLVEAREIVIADGTERTIGQIEAIRSGQAGDIKVNTALAALRRGMELAQPKELTRDVFAQILREHTPLDGRWTVAGITAFHTALTKAMK